jgi:hypothetical protein
MVQPLPGWHIYKPPQAAADQSVACPAKKKMITMRLSLAVLYPGAEINNQSLRSKHYLGTRAIILSGPPLPFFIFMGSATTYAPLAGSLSMLATFSKPMIFSLSRI